MPQTESPDLTVYFEPLLGCVFVALLLPEEFVLLPELFVDEPVDCFPLIVKR
ncbi:hypothetical protein SDC9_142971 [bioreactor metagenome]|uniref:Uncharacterized protein n=1 Tax=bioreactor metagenome TaxID=1076179 RepID=A0A645E2M8_9ZZZZ